MTLASVPTWPRSALELAALLGIAIAIVETVISLTGAKLGSEVIGAVRMVSCDWLGWVYTRSGLELPEMTKVVDA